jgi:glycosyltransferase involved in cell wall biosynthesis
MRILRVIASLDPRNGGPAAGLRAITPILAADGHDTEFVSLDDPAQVGDFKAPAKVHALGTGRGGYGYDPRVIPWLRAHAPEYDAVFVHGLWQFPGRAVHRGLRRNQPYFVFPHGMLDPWFRHAYPLKHFKKSIYWQLCERRVLRDAAAVLFTCEEERRLARLSFRPYRCTERVVAYGAARPGGDADAQRIAFRDRLPALGPKPFWLFLGRVHEKKGVDLLIEAYRQLATESAGASETLSALVIAGPCHDDALLSKLRAAGDRVPSPGQVHWTGMLDGDAKIGALREAEVFVLPSHQENFGIAVAEALSVGTPVLISDKVNICTEIAAAGAGLVDHDTLDGALGLLRRWRALTGSERAAMRAAARQLFDERYEIHRTARSLVETIGPFLSSAARSTNSISSTGRTG